MTEAEWLGAQQMRELVPGVELCSRRKRRLWAIACLRKLVLHWNGFAKNFDSALAVSERYVDDTSALAEQVGIRRTIAAERREMARLHGDEYPFHYSCISEATWLALDPTRVDLATIATRVTDALHAIHERPAWNAENRVLVEFAYDIFGNPFRPVAADPVWLTETVVGIARGIYDDRAFERLPILADALQDAGCEDEQVLSHCREPGTHVRGCWVLDLVLGKS